MLIFLAWNIFTQHVSDWQVLIFRTCLCCVYSLSFPRHFGNSNPSLSVITYTTHSTSGLGLPEWLICHAFYCSHIVGVVNDCVAAHCSVVGRRQYSLPTKRNVLKVTASHPTQLSQQEFCLWTLFKPKVIFESNLCEKKTSGLQNFDSRLWLDKCQLTRCHIVQGLAALYRHQTGLPSVSMTHHGAGPNIKPSADGWLHFQMLRHRHKHVPL